MDLTFDEVFDVVRSVVSRRGGVPLEEITVESHVYLDLSIDSLNFVELFSIFEKRFNLNILNNREWANLVTLGDSDKEEARELRWRLYRISTNISLKEYLDNLDFSEDVKVRAREIDEFSRRYNVQPFTIGCICACIVHIARSSTQSS